MTPHRPPHDRVSATWAMSPISSTATVINVTTTLLTAPRPATDARARATQPSSVRVAPMVPTSRFASATPVPSAFTSPSPPAAPSARGRPAPGPGPAPTRRRFDRGSAVLQLDAHRAELRAHCRRVLGSAFEAEDAVQETLVRAWRNIDGFEGRAALRSWLYRIATNVCIDMMRRRKPVAAVDPHLAEATGNVVGPATGGAAPSPSASVMAGPSSDAGSGARAGDPAELAVARDELRQALAAALRLLPPRQRAVLILGDVLRWRADEVADLLGTSVASVNSARQRAHATLAAKAPSADGPATADAPGDDQLLARLAEAFEHADVDSLVSLVRPS